MFKHGTVNKHKKIENHTKTTHSPATRDGYFELLRWLLTRPLRALIMTRQVLTIWVAEEKWACWMHGSTSSLPEKVTAGCFQPLPLLHQGKFLWHLPAQAAISFLPWLARLCFSHQRSNTWHNRNLSLQKSWGARYTNQCFLFYE